MNTIRILAQSDAESWRTLWNDYLAVYQAQLSEEKSQLTWQKLMVHPSINGWGAFNDEGKMIGFVHTVCHPNTWGDGDSCLMEDLFVAQPYRRRGVARQLIETVFTFARVSGLERVYWHTNTDNDAARALYAQLAWPTDTVQFRRDFPLKAV